MLERMDRNCWWGAYSSSVASLSIFKALLKCTLRKTCWGAKSLLSSKSPFAWTKGRYTVPLALPFGQSKIWCCSHRTACICWNRVSPRFGRCMLWQRRRPSGCSDPVWRRRHVAASVASLAGTAGDDDDTLEVSEAYRNAQASVTIRCMLFAGTVHNARSLCFPLIDAALMDYFRQEYNHKTMRGNCLFTDILEVVSWKAPSIWQFYAWQAHLEYRRQEWPACGLL